MQQPPAAVADLLNRRTENAYFLNRVSPVSEYFLHEYEHQHDVSAQPWAIGASGYPHGTVYAGGLPPWTYPLQLLVYIPSPLRAARVYLAVLNLISLAVLSALAWRASEESGGNRASCWASALGVLAIGAVNNTMTQGQNGLVVNGAIALALGTSSKAPTGEQIAGEGFALAVAMTKPSSSVLFLLAALSRRRYLSVGVGVTIVAAAAVFAGWWLRIPVPVQWAQFDRASLAVVDVGANPLLHGLSDALASTRAARNILGAIGVFVALIAAWRLGRGDLFGLLAVVGVVSRLFTYHAAYDDVLIAFLLIALASRALGRDGTMGWRAAWVLCGVTLWLPYTAYVSLYAQVLQITCWTLLAGALLLYPDRSAPRADRHAYSSTGGHEHIRLRSP